jgi:citrate lyase beta subunit
MSLIHPSQIDPISQMFSPTSGNRLRATSHQAFEEANGAMVPLPSAAS